ncbi:EAL domain-containing protein [Pseudomonas sp. PDM19]|uniref:EAL domain-containing response regulator n=1 Tax=Pseudomonas sp. PDM19 TaxID=2769272 RepID=UPI001784A69E|nr:EAL domain-containing protein [Pseudomonas sp. PDM19]MBD9634548.1 EAL domain-containing protein [Pseudomonas sp. PDM19]
MRPFSALILQAPCLHRTIAVAALQHLGYNYVTEMSFGEPALRQLRELDGVRLLLCDLRNEPAARLELLQVVARERLAQGVAIIGDLASGTWPALSRLLRLQGLQVLRLNGGPATQEQMVALLGTFEPSRADVPALPSLREIPSDHDVIVALSRGEIHAALQPKVSIKTGRIIGFEVLARWQRADNEIILPDQFLPVLRRKGLLDALLFTLIDQSVCTLQAYSEHHFNLAFNLEPSQLAQPGFAAQISHLLARLGIDPRQITFELTETEALPTPAVSLENLLQLRVLGCGLAIDDFGRGQSTLERLIELPFTEMKLKARFLMDLDEDPRRSAVLASAVLLSRALGLSVLAEGVESESQVQHLQRLGCEVAQGHYFYKPVMGNALTRLLLSEGLSGTSKIEADLTSQAFADENCRWRVVMSEARLCSL